MFAGAIDGGRWDRGQIGLAARQGIGGEGGSSHAHGERYSDIPKLKYKQKQETKGLNGTDPWPPL